MGEIEKPPPQKKIYFVSILNCFFFLLNDTNYGRGANACQVPRILQPGSSEILNLVNLQIGSKVILRKSIESPGLFSTNHYQINQISVPNFHIPDFRSV